MEQDEVMAVVGRLYIGNLIRDNEIKRLRLVVNELEARRLPVVDEDDDLMETANAGTD